MTNLSRKIERTRERHPTLDESLEQYRRDREKYDRQRDGRTQKQQYPPQRGVRRGYRV